MAKILVLTFTNMPGLRLDNFRQGFVDALANEGNQVLVLRSNDFLSEYQNSNELAPSIDPAILLGELVDFAPDLAISMNHSGLFPGLSKALDCPIAIWLLDGPSYLVDAQECRAKKDRYQMLTPVRAFRQDLKSSFGFENSQIHYLPFASDFHASELSQEQNISFVGTFFSSWRLEKQLKQLLSNRSLIDAIKQMLDSYASDADMLFAARLKSFGLQNFFSDGFDEAFMLNTISINRRLKVLEAIKDLGLSLYGNDEWLRALSYSYGLALSFNPCEIVSKESIEKIYNTSKINLNVSHAQARGGVPWRVFDAMASNGLLISDYQEDLDLLFGDELELPVYESPGEARDLCLRFLKDDEHRLELVQASQEAIEKGHRFKHRLEKLSAIVNLNLRPGTAGTLNFLAAEKFKKTQEENSATKTDLKDIGNEPLLFQLFQSQAVSFSQENSQLISVEPTETGQLKAEFTTPVSMPFLRLDIGEYFSRHSEVLLKVSRQQGSSQEGKTIQLKRDLLAHNQFNFDGSQLYCGFDSYCVFRNPFPGERITVSFQSKLEMKV